MKIAGIDVLPNLCLAPMAGITSAPFRLLSRRYGAGMSWSELVSSNALRQRRFRAKQAALKRNGQEALQPPSRNAETPVAGIAKPSIPR